MFSAKFTATSSFLCIGGSVSKWGWEACYVWSSRRSGMQRRNFGRLKVTVHNPICAKVDVIIGLERF